MASNEQYRKAPRPAAHREHRENREIKDTPEGWEKEAKAPKEGGSPKPYNRRRRYYHGKPGKPGE